MLTQTAEYALQAVLHIAGAADEGPVRVDSIAEALGIPRNYLSKVLHALARSGVLNSTRGPTGGFTLARPASEITLARVIEDFDPIEDRCLLMRRKCSDTNPCIVHFEWKHVALQMRAFFRETTLADIVHGEATAPSMVFPRPHPRTS